jgi:hypothetical protein
MTEFPVPLDILIAYVKQLDPNGGPLDNVSDAFALSERLGEQADALIGYFVDQARRSGASWSQIGTAMGVSKQAAQKRFVSLAPEGQTYSRFTERCRNVIAAAGQLAAADGGAAGRLASDAHLTAALFVEPYGLAAKMVASAGLTPEQVYTAVGAGPATRAQDVTLPALHEIRFTKAGEAALKGALRAALRLGHNYIGTEHVLLGLLDSGERVPGALAALGLTTQRAEEMVRAWVIEVEASEKEN